MRPVLVGQAPGGKAARTAIPDTIRASDGLHDRNALYPYPSSSGSRIMRLLNLTVEEYDNLFDRMNLLPDFHGKSGKGDRFDKNRAFKENARFRDRVAGRKVVLLGKSVAHVLGFKTDYFEVQMVSLFCSGEAMVFPHPSGVNRWWNDEGDVRRAADALQDFLEL